jgi:site-specific recombinase XerD
MRRESVATLRVRNLAPGWGLRGVVVKGCKTRDIPLPTAAIQYLEQYVEQVVAKENGPLTPDTPIFRSSWGQRHRGAVTRPMTGKNIWRLCKVYGRIPELRPHDLRHGVTMEVYGQHHDLEQVRALLGHTRLETTQVYARIQPKERKAAVNFYEARALEVLS